MSVDCKYSASSMRQEVTFLWLTVTLTTLSLLETTHQNNGDKQEF